VHIIVTGGPKTKEVRGREREREREGEQDGQWVRRSEALCSHPYAECNKWFSKLFCIISFWEHRPGNP